MSIAAKRNESVGQIRDKLLPPRFGPAKIEIGAPTAKNAPTSPAAISRLSALPTRTTTLATATERTTAIRAAWRNRR